MDNVDRKSRKCSHLEDGRFAKHSTLSYTTVPKEENTTDYHWDLTTELCPLCSGMVYAMLRDLFNDDPRPKGQA